MLHDSPSVLGDHAWNARQVIRLVANRLTGGALNRRRIRSRLGYGPGSGPPRTFNEKVLWRMRHDRRPEMITFCDKLATRDWLRDRLGPDRAAAILPELLHVVPGVRELAGLPLGGGAVVKSNHGSGRGIILRDGEPVDRDALMRSAARWMRRGFGVGRGEWGYGHVPRRIMVERYLPNEHGRPASDLKFYVFDGRAVYVRAIIDRFGDTARVAMDRSGAWHPVQSRVDRTGPRVPDIPGFAEMRDIAEELCAGLDFLRVDFLWTDDRFHLNETTAYPMAGAMPLGGYENDLWLGSFWSLPGSGHGARSQV